MYSSKNYISLKVNLTTECLLQAEKLYHENQFGDMKVRFFIHRCLLDHFCASNCHCKLHHSDLWQYKINIIGKHHKQDLCHKKTKIWSQTLFLCVIKLFFKLYIMSPYIAVHVTFCLSIWDTSSLKFACLLFIKNLGTTINSIQ